MGVTGCYAPGELSHGEYTGQNLLLEVSVNEILVSLSTRIPKRLHRAARLASLEAGVTLSAFITAALEDELNHRPHPAARSNAGRRRATRAVVPLTSPSSQRALVPTRATPPAGHEYPDTERYKGRFAVRSETTKNRYLVSFDMAMMCWVCSCPGGITKGQCKHLTANGLKGRKFGRQLKEARRHGWLT